MKGKPAYLMTLGVICRITGDFSSTAASAAAVRLSRFCSSKLGLRSRFFLRDH
jgi:hypothetical protein